MLDFSVIALIVVALWGVLGYRAESRRTNAEKAHRARLAEFHRLAELRSRERALQREFPSREAERRAKAATKALRIVNGVPVKRSPN